MFVIVTIPLINEFFPDGVDFVLVEIWLVQIVKMVWIYVAEGKSNLYIVLSLNVLNTKMDFFFFFFYVFQVTMCLQHFWTKLQVR